MATFKEPVRAIKAPLDMPKWLKSQAYQDYVSFLQALNSATRSKKNSLGPLNECDVTLQVVIDNLMKLQDMVRDTPPVDQASRFGNQAYKTWFEKMESQSSAMCKRLLSEESSEASIELVAYWKDSFGNKLRIDYGTGHEMNFFVFLLCLAKLKLIKESNFLPCITKVFTAYMELVRRLQMTYKMEPAGSHGVYSLDDFQFLPFYFGSSQLIDSTLEPKDIPEEGKMAENRDEYLLCAAVHYINQVKTGPFSEHSNQLWNISGVPHWNKVNEGFMKMYKAEVLAKFPIVQHCLFGSLFSIEKFSQ